MAMQTLVKTHRRFWQLGSTLVKISRCLYLVMGLGVGPPLVPWKCMPLAALAVCCPFKRVQMSCIMFPQCHSNSPSEAAILSFLASCASQCARCREECSESMRWPQIQQLMLDRLEESHGRDACFWFMYNKPTNKYFQRQKLARWKWRVHWVHIQMKEASSIYQLLWNTDCWSCEDRPANTYNSVLCWMLRTSKAKTSQTTKHVSSFIFTPSKSKAQRLYG